MSCTAALGLRYALNCTIFDATVTAVFSPDGTTACYGSPLPLFQIPLTHATVTPLLMPDYPTRMSISATMRFSHPTCYLQDRDEIADDVIIAQFRNRYVKVTVISVHPLTVQSGINPRATVASIKVLLGGVKTSK